MVLDIPWLQDLGQVIHDYKNMTMEFKWKNKKVKLKGDSELSGRKVTFNQLQGMVKREEVQEFYELTWQQNTDTEATSKAMEICGNLPQAITKILQEFDRIFKEPKGLPPHRLFDHRIHLNPHSKPVNVRPYRYHHFQKGEIEKLVKEMLAQGIIQPSQSPYSSPVLLVRKKDGTIAFVWIIEL